MTKFERIVERLKKEPFLSGFTFRKSDSSFIQKFDGGLRRIDLEHFNDIICITVLPHFEVRFDIAPKWFEKFSFKTLRDQRNNGTVGASSGMLGFEDGYDFENSQKDFDKEYAALVKCLKSGAEEVFTKYATLEDVYKYDIVPILKGEKLMKDFGGVDYLFDYLMICRIVAPENYNQYKNLFLEYADNTKKHSGPGYRNPNMLYYCDMMDEICSYLESLDLDKMMQSNGKKVILLKK